LVAIYDVSSAQPAITLRRKFGQKYGAKNVRNSKSTASLFNLIGGKTVTLLSSPNPSPRWTREQIRAARQVPLVPLLQKRGLQLIEKEAGNFELPAFPGLIVKESYWRWPQRNLAGNTIDFFVQVLGMNFHNAMRQITGP
jgi:hypothetical protein